MEKMMVIFEKEEEIKIMALNMMIKQSYHPYYEYMMESKKEGKNIFERMVDKIRSIIEFIQNKINDFFSSSKLKKMEDETKELLDNESSAKNKKIKVKDLKKLDALDEKTLKELKTSKDPKAVIEKYKKQRNAILAGGGILITVGAFFLYNNKKRFDKQVNGLQSTVGYLNNIIGESDQMISSLQSSLKSTTEENEAIKSKMRDLEHSAKRSKAKADDLSSQRKLHEQKITELEGKNKSQREKIKEMESVISKGDTNQRVLQLRIKQQQDLIESVSSFITLKKKCN